MSGQQRRVWPADCFDSTAMECVLDLMGWGSAGAAGRVTRHAERLVMLARANVAARRLVPGRRSRTVGGCWRAPTPACTGLWRPERDPLGGGLEIHLPALTGRTPASQVLLERTLRGVELASALAPSRTCPSAVRQLAQQEDRNACSGSALRNSGAALRRSSPQLRCASAEPSRTRWPRFDGHDRGDG